MKVFELSELSSCQCPENLLSMVKCGSNSNIGYAPKWSSEPLPYPIFDYVEVI
jgi:hypothetical protein